MNRKQIIRIIVFVIIFVALLIKANSIFAAADYRNYQWVRGFYEEQEESLDAVCIGSSKMYAYWNPLEAWSQYGIAGFPYTTSSQHFMAAEYLIKEAVKTQPNAVFVVGVNSVGETDFGMVSCHYLLDYMPFSLNKIQLTQRLAECGEHEFFESMELYVPLIRFHSRWNELTEEDFTYSVDGLKGANLKEDYLNKDTKIGDPSNLSKEKGKIYKNLREGLDSLLNYCDEEKIQVLFVSVPCMEEEIEIVNSMKDIIVDRGYPFLELNQEIDAMGLDLTQDYYNTTHTNIHGSIKVTQYLAEYLMKNYGFEDKRGNETYSSWDEAVAKYWDIIGKSVLDFEWEAGNRDYSIEAVNEVTAEKTEDTVELSWEESLNADGYMVYRKVDDGNWENIAVAEACNFYDVDLIGESYQYRIVPFGEKDGNICYGNFEYKGVTVE